ncbi:TPA: hypothetical protein N0F65_011504, partial [Lagenidium giganteum]
MGDTADGWFRKNLRCSRAAFLEIVDRVTERWKNLHPPVLHSRFTIQDRVAATLFYFCHGVSMEQAGRIAGMSERAKVFINQVIHTLESSWLDDVIRLPRT